MTEKIEARRDGARQVKNSGRGMIKGDAIIQAGDMRFTVDYKEAKQSFNINPRVWGKVCTDAHSNSGSNPTLKITLGEQNSKVRLFLIEENIMHHYLELLRREQDERA